MSQETPPIDYGALIDAQFDGMLTDEQARQLQDWLVASPDHAVVFARRAQEHQHLRQVFSGERVSHLAGSIGSGSADGFSIEQLALLDDSGQDIELVDLTDRLDRERREKHRPRPVVSQPKQTSGPRTIVIPQAAVWISIAAVLGLALWIGMELTRPEPIQTTPPTAEADPAPPVQAPRDPFAQPAPARAPSARLLATHQAQWTPGSAVPRSGGAMVPGEYKLDAGYAHLEMADGATVILQAPAVLTLHSSSRVSLSEGVLSAYVPEGAEGFVVDTPAGRVLDLGTEFGVEVIGEDRVEVQVMTGRVVASLPGQGATRTMRAGDAAQMNTAAARIQPVVAHAQKFARTWTEVERAVRVSDAVRYLYDTPESVRAGALEDNDVLFLLPEHRGIELPRYRVLCDFLTPGRYDRLSSAVGAAHGGTVVDSYLLHYDRVGTPNELVFVEGTIHFDRPIVGVIAGPQRLFDSDAMFAVAETAYPQSSYPGRGFEGFGHAPRGGEQDVVTISPDRRTLTVRLGTSTNIDQLRVLVEAEASP